MIRRLLLAATLCVTTGCARPVSSSPSGLTVLAAASLRDVLAEIRAAYAIARPGISLTVTTDSSATLASQIIEGAPADVFLAADEAAPKRIVDAGMAEGTATRFASNRLAVIVAAGEAGTIRSAADLARPGIKIIAAGPDVPITRYATILVERLARQPGYPPGFAAAYAANVVSREDNVKAVVAKIELGEGDAAIVYATDAAGSTGVTTLTVPDAAQVSAEYAGVVLRASRFPDAARALMGWIVGPDGQALLARAGFQPPAP